MKFITLITVLASVLPAVFGQGQMTINTPPSAVECEPTMFNWSGGTAPYYLSLIPGGQASAAPLKEFPTQTGTTYTWLTDIQAGVGFTISLKDSTGLTAFSDVVTVQPGSSTSCVNAVVQEGGSTTDSALTAPAATPSSGSSATTSGTAATTTHASGSSTAPTATGSAVSTTASNAASRLSLSSTFGIAGVMGLVGAALF
jgi:hypothetical protein